jgi:ABC-type transport system involved in multi-copper enzyme maturation permease subunit
MTTMAERSAPAGSWSRWTKQIRAMLWLEVRKTFWRPRALPVVIVAFLPAFILALRAIGHALGADETGQGAADVARVYGGIFQLFFVRLVIFFGCFGIFTYLARGEMAERSLHFYLLAPLKREVFLAGKFAAGFVAAGTLFTLSLATQLALAFLPGVTAGGAGYLFSGPGLGHALAYWGVTLLAVVGYGAVFLTLGLLVKNPMIPAAALLGWEWLNFLLPPALKKISVIHHLQSLCPFPVPKGPFALPAEPTPAWLAAPGVLVLAAVLLWLAARRARRLEVAYAAE